MPRAALTLASRAYVQSLQLVAAGDRGRGTPSAFPNPPRPRKIDLYWAEPSRNQRVVRMFRCGGDAAFVPVTSASFSSAPVGAFPSGPGDSVGPAGHSSARPHARMSFPGFGLTSSRWVAPSGSIAGAVTAGERSFQRHLRAPSGSTGAVWDLPGVCQIHGHTRKLGREACAS